MTVEELSDKDLVQKARELQGLDKIKKAVTAEIKARIESGDDLTPFGASVGAPTKRKKIKSAEEILPMLNPAFVIEDLYEYNEVSGSLKII